MLMHFILIFFIQLHVNKTLKTDLSCHKTTLQLVITSWYIEWLKKWNTRVLYNCIVCVIFGLHVMFD